MSQKITTAEGCHLCGQKDYKLLVPVDQKPAKETDYGINPEIYYREICQCNNCQVYFNRHDGLIPDDFYEGHYNASIKMGSLQRRFDKIINLPMANSDNKHRAERVNSFMIGQGFDPTKSNALDVGCGTCVFLHEMKKFGYHSHCIDPDPISIKHAIDNVGVDSGFAGVLEDYHTNLKFQLISFNKVLEHVKNPSLILEQTKAFLADDGLVYVELPYGSEIVEAGEMVQRSEFFLEHYTTFNHAAYKVLAEQAKFEVLHLDTLHDPSGKHTIYGFLKVAK